METKQTGKKLDARERARIARTRADQVRAERDTKIEANLAEFFTAGDERATWSPNWPPSRTQSGAARSVSSGLVRASALSPISSHLSSKK